MALILIADDDEIVVDMVRDALAARGHIVGAVDDGGSVLAVVQYKHPDLVILDCGMPEVSGLEALRQIRLSLRSFATPVLILTGRHGQADEEIAMRGGANDYMRKPFDPDRLVARVEALIEHAEAQRRPTAPRQVARPWPPVERAWGQR